MKIFDISPKEIQELRHSLKSEIGHEGLVTTFEFGTFFGLANIEKWERNKSVPGGKNPSGSAQIILQLFELFFILMKNKKTKTIIQKIVKILIDELGALKIKELNKFIELPLIKILHKNLK